MALSIHALLVLAMRAKYGAARSSRLAASGGSGSSADGSGTRWPSGHPAAYRSLITMWYSAMSASPRAASWSGLR